MKRIGNHVRRALVVGVCALVALSTPALSGEAEDKQHKADYSLAMAVAKQVYGLHHYGAFDWINIYVSQGVVTFTGDVAMKNLVSDAEEVTKKIDGVKKVNNDLQWLGSSERDKRIRVMGYDAIYQKFLPEYSALKPGERYAGGDRMHEGPHPIHILVKDGHVTLMGFVYSAGDKSHATKAMKTVIGVKDVESHLAVVPKPKKSD